MHKTIAIPLCLTAAFSAVFSRASGAEESGVYELRIYTCELGKLDALHERFRKHTLGLFEKHGMENIAYWTPTDEPKSANTLVYLLRHKSREAAKASWAAFLNDPEWKQVAAASERDHGKILAAAPFSVYLVPTDYSPELQPIHRDMLYELRVYTAADGKFDALHARFRDHTDRLFTKHGLQSYAYWTPTDKPASASTLYYVLAYPDRDQAQQSWKAFLGDPDWQAARKASEADGSLLATRPESTYMQPTDYSPAAKPAP